MWMKIRQKANILGIIMRYIKITNCYNCPYATHSKLSPYICSKKNGRELPSKFDEHSGFPLLDITEPPAWCPLPKVKE